MLAEHQQSINNNNSMADVMMSQLAACRSSCCGLINKPCTTLLTLLMLPALSQTGNCTGFFIGVSAMMVCAYAVGRLLYVAPLPTQQAHLVAH
jgi:hypothetical protein